MKDIVFCADGTWNGQDVDRDDDGVPDTTNVLKLFHLLQGETTLESRRLKDESEKVLGDSARPTLIAKYLHGVGDSDSPIMKVAGGAFGSGLIARIVRGYTYVSRNYQPGDRITIVGFSRGAYTARALAGMISSVGLLDPKEMEQNETDKGKDDPRERVYGMGVSAWRRYRDNARAQQKDQTLRQKLADLVTKVPLFAKTSPLPASMVPAPLYAVAVWDTVGALGIPNMGKTAGEADAYRFADDLLSSNVAHGLHAVSYDEKRASFAPTLWQKDGRIQQYWFAGAHSDVGGGYPAAESGLSNIALKWMVEELEKLGLPFKPFPQDWLLNPYQDGHEPWRHGLFKAVPPVDRVWEGFDLIEHATFVSRRTWISAGRPASFGAGDTVVASAAGPSATA